MATGLKVAGPQVAMAFSVEEVPCRGTEFSPPDAGFGRLGLGNCKKAFAGT